MYNHFKLLKFFNDFNIFNINNYSINLNKFDKQIYRTLATYMLHNDIGNLYNSHFSQQTLMRVITKACWCINLLAIQAYMRV